MSNRPEILFPLFADLTSLTGVGPKVAQNFGHMDIGNPRDLVFTLPYNVIDRTIVETVSDVAPPKIVTVEVEVGEHRPNQIKGRPYRVFVTDATTTFQLVFFHARANVLRQNLPTGQRRIVSGKLEMFDGMAQMVHPDYIVRPDQADKIPRFEPVYPLTAGISAQLMVKAVRAALGRVTALPEWINPSIKELNEWPDWLDAVQHAHAPQSLADVSPRSKARERLAYDELLAHQTTLAIARARRQKKKGVVTKSEGKLQDKVRAGLPYRLTAAQERTIKEIQADMAAPIRMNRLLQGDVGAGKTLVAFFAMLTATEVGGQSVMMAPTELLARQHLAALQPLAEKAGVVLEILTGRDKGKERQAKLKALAENKIQILVGTHAVFQKDVIYADLRLAIVDEQHRFGVRQRMELGAKNAAVDVLVMTATPIPRSLTLAHYGDMDLSVLDEKPPGRVPITTVLVSDTRTDEVVERLRAAVEQGRQAYWVCPLVDESESVDLAAATERFRKLRTALGQDVVGLVHGQMPSAERDAAMARFQSGETKVLVATTVIEVGVDVPNATIIVIERADHFGLAQLHQLRGRVGRGTEASTCLLLYSAPLGETARARLSVIRETEDGFKIAEEDLRLRGAGDVLGLAQSGLPRFQIADLEHQAHLLEVAHDDAKLLLVQDETLKSERGQAVRTLLCLMKQDRGILLLSVG